MYNRKKANLIKLNNNSPKQQSFKGYYKKYK